MKELLPVHRRRTATVGIYGSVGKCSSRATGRTTYLGNGDAPEHAQAMGRAR